MPTTRDDVVATLAVQDPGALRAILQASEIDDGAAGSGAALAQAIADAIWRSYHTPLGYYVEPAPLEEIVRHVARKLGAHDRLDPDDDAWAQLRALTRALVADTGAAVTLDDLDPATRRRLGASFAAPLGWGTGATGSFGARWASARALALFRGPIGRVLPLLPVVGPLATAVRSGLGAVYAVSGPLGLAMTVLSVNAALSTNYRRLVPLLLGIGALGR